MTLRAHIQIVARQAPLSAKLIMPTSYGARALPLMFIALMRYFTDCRIAFNKDCFVCLVSYSSGTCVYYVPRPWSVPMSVFTAYIIEKPISTTSNQSKAWIFAHNQHTWVAFRRVSSALKTTGCRPGNICNKSCKNLYKCRNVEQCYIIYFI